MKRLIHGAVVILLGLSVASCYSGPPDLTGMWAADDGTTTLFASDGRCQNMMTVDIGGGMSCVVSENTNEAGQYTLLVTQGPNKRTLYLQEAEGDALEVFNGAGELHWTMTKQ